MFPTRLPTTVIFAICFLGCTAQKEQSKVVRAPWKNVGETTRALTDLGVEVHDWGGEYGVVLNVEHLPILPQIATILGSITRDVSPIILEIDTVAICSQASVFRNVECLGGVALRKFTLTETGVRELAATRRIERLKLEGMQVTTEAVTALRALQNLKSLEIWADGDQSGRNMADVITASRSCRKLTDLSLAAFAETRDVCEAINGLQHLKSLSFFFCKFENATTPLFADGSLQQLQSLHVTEGDVTSEHLLFLRHCPEMRELDISSRCQLDDSIPVSLANCKKLQSVSLSPTVVTNRGLNVFCKLPTIEKLCIHGSLIDDTALSALAQLMKLRELSLYCSRISGHGIRNCSLPPELTKLSIQPTLVHVEDLEAMPKRVRSMLMDSLTGLHGGGLRIWDTSTGKVRMIGAPYISADDLILLEGGQTIVACPGVGFGRSDLIWWELRTGCVVGHYPLPVFPTSTGAVCPNGKSMAISTGETIRIESLETGQTIVTLKNEGATTRMRFSDNGRYLAATIADSESSIEVYDLEDNGKIMNAVEGVHVIFSSDSEYFAVNDWDSVVYPIGSNEPVLCLKDSTLQFLDGSRALIEFPQDNDTRIRDFGIHDIKSDERLSRFKFHPDHHSSAWAATRDGSLFAQLEDSSIVVYDQKTVERQSTIDANQFMKTADEYDNESVGGSFLFADSDTLVGEIHRSGSDYH